MKSSALKIVPNVNVASTPTTSESSAIKPRRKLFIGSTHSPMMQARSMELYPVPNADGSLTLATKWLEAVEWLRHHSKRGWNMDRRVKRQKNPA